MYVIIPYRVVRGTANWNTAPITIADIISDDITCGSFQFDTFTITFKGIALYQGVWGLIKIDSRTCIE